MSGNSAQIGTAVFTAVPTAIAVALILPAILNSAIGSAAAAETATETSEWDRPHGPIHLANQSPIQRLRLEYTPELPTALGSGEIELRLDVGWMNYWGSETGLNFDFDAVTIMPALRVGITEWLELGLLQRLSWRGTSTLGGLIKYWHRMIGHYEDRDGFAPNDFYFRRDNQPILRRDRDIGWGLGDTILQAKFPLLANASRTDALAVTALLKIPTGDAGNHFASAGVDVGLMLTGMASVRQFTVYAGLGGIRHEPTPVYTFAIREFQFVLHLGFELRLGRAIAVHAELLFQTASTDDHFELARENMELHIGLSMRLLPNLLLNLSFAENTFSVSNAIDMGWHAGLTWCV